MLGLVALGLTTIMIYTLVKNALIGQQLSGGHAYLGTCELLIPITDESKFHLEPWKESLSKFQKLQGRVKIHLLINGHHPKASYWQDLHQLFPFVEIHTFLMKPEGVEAAPWMIEQMRPRINGQVVIIGDAELVPTEAAFSSLSTIVTEKGRPYFTLPQTAHLNVLGEAIAVLNPTLAFASVFGFRKIRKNISHPLIGLTQGWMGMDLKTFQELNFGENRIPNWKHAISYQWDKSNKTYLLAFGEKNLIRYYPKNLKEQLIEMKTFWSYLFLNTDRTGLWLYFVSLFLWAFPILCFFTHPYWSLASAGLLILYRFFSKIVFQESWTAFFLHFVGAFGWIGTLIWPGIEALKTKFGSKAQKYN